MKTVRVVLFSLTFLAFQIPVFAQVASHVDSTWLYFSYQNGGLRVPFVSNGYVVDARLSLNNNNTRYSLEEGKTFSYRGGDAYYPMAGFTSTQYTQGYLKRTNFGNENYEMNYRLLFPKNYTANPDFPDGYPLIVMSHGLGEVGNCTLPNGGSCYFANQIWDPARNTVDSRTIIPKVYNVSITRSGNTLTFTTSEPHFFLANQSIIITNSTVSGYNSSPTRTIASVPSSTTFTVSYSGSATGAATANVLNNSNAQFTFPTSPNPPNLNTYGGNDIIIVRGDHAGYNGVRRLVKLDNNKFKISTSYTTNYNPASNSFTSGVLSYNSNFTTGTIERYVAKVYTITAAASGGGSSTTFTTSEPHQFIVGGSLSSNQVIISNSTVPSYDGTYTVTATPSTTTFTVNRTFAGTATALAARPTTVQQLLNNDHNMVHGGAVHQSAVNLVPTGMNPDDPNLPPRSFPGFVLFPQNLNTWSTSRREDSKLIMIIRLLMKKYNIDPNRIYVHGLSDGGSNAYRMARSAPWLFAATLPMSAVDNANITQGTMFSYIRTIPIWTFQGGTDGNPTPTETLDYISQFNNQGMSTRYTLYANLGHGTWNAAYAEPDFFTWMLSKNKSDIFVRFGKTEICGTTGDGVIMELAQGFFAYQWEKDGEIIPGATSYLDTAKVPGTYRARFSRVPNPGENDWNRWSKPVTITESTPAKPVIAASGSQVFPTINGNGVENGVTLRASEDADRYYWYYNGNQNPIVHAGVNASFQDTVSFITRAGGSNPGYYTLRTADLGNCPSPLSDPEYYVWGANLNITAPSAFAGQATSTSSIFLSWTDNSNNERGFEIWRRKAGETIFKFITRTPEDAVSYLDSALESNTTYQYKVRAVSNSGRSPHAPSDVLNTNLVVSTPADTTPPTAPQNLVVTFFDANNITLTWDAATDNTGIQQYIVHYGGQSVETNSSQTTYTLTGLTLNTIYPISVVAEDTEDNLSEPSNQVLGNTYVSGLFYGHSTGAWSYIDPTLSAAAEDNPPMQWHTFEFYGSTVENPSFNTISQPSNLGTGGLATQSDFYNFKFDGYIDVPNNSASVATLTQTYQFRTSSDDGSMLFIDGFNPFDITENRVVDNDGIQGTTTATSNEILLAPGPHRIVVLYFERTGGQNLTVEYRVKRTDNNWTNWASVPRTSGVVNTTNPPYLPLRSGIYTPPTAPTAPANLAATATGMTTIDLTWNYGAGSNSPDEFEVYRGIEETGDYTMLARTDLLTYTDNTGLPGTTYYYKLKTVNANGTSVFSAVASAATFGDSEAPSIPAFVTLASKTFTNVAFTWTAATDNVAVTGYEVLIDNVELGTTTSTSYMAMNLNPGTLYNFTVKAFDASGNKSAASVPLAVTTNMGQIFYSKDEGVLSTTSTWGDQPDGSGTAPSFAVNGQIYQVANRTSADVGGSLTIQGTASKLIVPADVTLIVDQPLSAKLELQGNAVVLLEDSTTPEFISVSDNSTIHFNGTNTIPARQYGNVVLTGVGNKNFGVGETIIRGNLTASGPVSLKGGAGNTSRLTLHGNLVLDDVPGLVASDNTLDLVLANPTSQSLTVPGSIDFFRITTQPNASVNLSTTSPVTLSLGSGAGGGLVLANGSTLNLGNNHLSLKSAGTINAGGQTGQIAINGSNLSLASSSAQNSNLYVNATNRTAALVTSNFSGTGRLNIQSPLLITEGLKILAGEFNAGAGNVTLVSNQTNTAYLQEIENNGAVTGQVNVQRWVSVARKYRYMSSPVANLTVASFQPYIPVTGAFTGANTNATVASMFYWNAAAETPAYVPYPVTANTEMFEKGRGYSIYNFNGLNPLTLTTSGTPYQGNWSYGLAGGTGGNDGWNLIGNPYASAIQWNNGASNWTRTGVSTTVHVPDNTSGTLVFRTYDAVSGLGTLANGIIAPGQAFWVQATTASPELTITERAKRTNTSSFYREEAPVTSFTVFLNSSTAQDPAYIILGNNFTDAFESAADGRKRNNEVLNLSSRSSDQVDLVFNKVSDSFCEKQIGLTIQNVAPGSYSLTFANIANVLGVGEIVLTDNFTQTTKVVNDSEAYAFAVTSAPASFGANRFTLSLARPALQKTASVSVADLCGGTMAQVQLTNTQPGAFYYVSKVGTSDLASMEVTSTGGALTLDIPVANLQAGVNTFDIHTGFKGCSNELLQTTPVSITYTPAPEIRITEPYYSICSGTSLTLQAETNGNNTFAWYRNGTLVAQGNVPELNTDALKQTTTFEVVAITANGCASGRMPITVEVENVAAPVVAFDGYALTLTESVTENTFVQWYKNQEPLEVYTPYIEPAEEGFYTVLVSKNGCSKVSDAFSFVVTGIEEDPDAVNGLTAYVYPNPATADQLYVNLEVTAQQDVEITMNDLAGRLVFNQRLANKSANGIHRLNLHGDTAPGLYIITIQQGKAVLKRKVIVTFR
jgi:fibronectin type 3 domain-containing protein